MKVLKPTKDEIYKGNLILVNYKYPIKSNVELFSLEEFNEKFSKILFHKNANKYLQFIFNEIECSNKIIPVSGFRTLEEQQEIYNTSIKENGIKFTKKYVALPNTSEHQTGLAIDLGLKLRKIDFIRPKFPHSGICNKFRKEAIKFGFIERYSKEKEKITKISAEEWHFRYVGYPHSEIINNYNFCLEEYIEYLKHHKIKYKNYEIYYVPFEENMKITINDDDIISGNNIDGFIITKKL